MKFWSLAIVVVLILDDVSSWQQSVESRNYAKNFSWLEWFSDTFYKTFYVVLISAILLCATYNFIRNKFGKKIDGWTVENNKCMEGYSKVLSMIDSPQKNNLNDGDRPRYSETESQLRQRLKQTQDEVQCLRDQLTMSMNNKAELESTLALIDKEKISAEMQLELDRVQGALELEKLKKENLIVQREIQKLLEEKDFAEKEVERLDRDVRISQRAAVDAEFLEERLLTVKKEAKILKEQFHFLAEEKGKASSVLSEPSSKPSFQDDDMDFENSANWTAPDFVREYMSLD